MNLHGIASPYVAAVNPLVEVSVQVSIGKGTPNPDGTTPPAFAAPVRRLAQIQPTTWRDIQMLEGINVEGVRWKIYLNGQVDGLVRVERKGGDLITIPTGRHAGVWLVAQVLEQYPDWVSAAITLQNGS